MSSKIDNILSGVIIVLMVVMLFKWYETKYCSNTMGVNNVHSKMPKNSLRGSLEDTPEMRVTRSSPSKKYIDEFSDDYQSSIVKMSVDNSVSQSHDDWCSSLTMNGLPTGASSCTKLEETGRSYGTADFVGLTSRKFCKARQLATPANDVRVTPSSNVLEYCDIGMDEMI